MSDDDLKFRFLDPFEAPLVTGLELLRREGVQLALPIELRPEQLRGCLWEIIYALASRRVFVHSTDHLSDGSLYAWLHDHWLPNRIPDVPPEAEWNCNLDVIGGGSEEDNQIWLRHYADEELRQKWRHDFPEDLVPEHQTPPFDRDRWLPRPPAQADPALAEASADGSDDDETTPAPVDELDDPLQLSAVDEAIRAEHPALNFLAGASEEEPPTDSSGTWEELLAEPGVGVDTDDWRTPHDELAQAGVVLPPPDELTDELLPSKLWELIHELACCGFYLLRTDHLRDRELYTLLWTENLREPAILPGRSASGGWYHDCVGSGGEKDTETWLRYYANDVERESHARNHPGHPIPPRGKCPAHRDHRLPKGPL